MAEKMYLSPPAPRIADEFGGGKTAVTGTKWSDGIRNPARVLLEVSELLRAGRLGNDVAVTCLGRRDGVGQQARSVISAMNYAYAAGCSYLHSPFRDIEHAEGDREEWTRRWESFLNLAAGERILQDDAVLVTPWDVAASPETYAGRSIVIYSHEFVALGSARPRSELRAKYWQSPKDGILLHRGPPGTLTAAVHVRRGDVTPSNYGHLYVADEVILSTIAQLRDVTEKLRQPLHINVYSEGPPEMFRAFAAAGCRLHLDTDPFEAFHNLVTADILLPAPSGFSRTAAMLSEAILIHGMEPPPDRSRFVMRHGDGSFSRKKLRKAMWPALSWRAKMAFKMGRFWRQHVPFRGRSA
jgi:hypothetical protein